MPQQATSISRREALKKLAYVPPAISTLTLAPSFAAYASGQFGDSSSGAPPRGSGSNNGHGNNSDGVDSSNPGRGGGRGNDSNPNRDDEN